MYRRSMFSTVLARLRERRRFLRVLKASALSSHYASADAPSLQSRTWIEQQWDVARLLTREGKGRAGAVLVLDEIQKVPGWSDVVKRCWDADTAARCPLKVVLLGSAPLLVQQGLTESLAGRFELIPMPHWAYPARDVLLMTRVDKPALLRRLFQLGCTHSGQILPYQKMLGQLHDAGNTTTLANHLDLLAGAGMLTGLAKFSPERVRQRASSPKLQVLNTALLSAQAPLAFSDARRTPEVWGRLMESAVGSHLLNSSMGTAAEVFYWRDRGREIDFVARLGKRLVAIEVKSGASKGSLPGMEAFARAFRPQRSLLIGGDGLPLEQFSQAGVADVVSG